MVPLLELTPTHRQSAELVHLGIRLLAWHREHARGFQGAVSDRANEEGAWGASCLLVPQYLIHATSRFGGCTLATTVYWVGGRRACFVSPSHRDGTAAMVRTADNCEATVQPAAAQLPPSCSSHRLVMSHSYWLCIHFLSFPFCQGALLGGCWVLGKARPRESDRGVVSRTRRAFILYFSPGSPGGVASFPSLHSHCIRMRAEVREAVFRLAVPPRRHRGDGEDSR